MAGLRFDIHLSGFIPESPTGTDVAGVMIPTVIANKIPTIRTEVQDIKSFVANMQRILSDENLSLTATYHKCYHNESPPRPCELEHDL